MTEDMDDVRLDALLAAYGAGEADAALRGRIIAAAPRERAVGRALRWVGGAGLGAALAGACAAGVVTGLTLAPASLARALSGHPATPAAEASSLADPAVDPAIS
jgi:hypothetical protein